MYEHPTVVVGRRITSKIEDRCWFQVCEVNRPAFIAAAEAAGLKPEPIPTSGDWKPSHGDSIYVELESLEPLTPEELQQEANLLEQSLSDKVPLTLLTEAELLNPKSGRVTLEHAAKLGHEEIGLLLEVFSLNQPESPPPVEKYFSRRGWLCEYQCSRWLKLDADRFKQRVARLNAMNIEKIQRGMLALGSPFYLMGGILFGITSPLFPILSLMLISIYQPSPAGHVVWWSVVLAQMSMAMSIDRYLARQRGIYAGLRILVGFWILFAAQHCGIDVATQFAAVFIGWMIYCYWQRRRDWMDQRDLMSAAFSRELEIVNPELRPPEKWPGLGSDQVILWRLRGFPVHSTFRPDRLTRVFISHRNSAMGKTRSWNVKKLLQADLTIFLDSDALRGGLRWRDQLLNALIESGFLIVVMTKEHQDSDYKWVRREMFAGCLAYRRYGTPIPIVIEAGYTLADFLAREEQNGYLQTPVHMIQSRISCVAWDGDDQNSLQRFATTLKIEIKRRTLEEIVLRRERLLPY